MNRYTAKVRLFLSAEERYAEPGEVIELSDESAAILLDADAIAPVEEHAEDASSADHE